MTTCPYGACQDSNVVIITAPSHVRDDVLKHIQPAITHNKPVFVGVIANVVPWGMKDVPHIAYDLIPGKSVSPGGAKYQRYMALHREAICCCYHGSSMARLTCAVFCVALMYAMTFAVTLKVDGLSK